MIKHGVLATINQQIDYETAAIAAIGLGYEVTEAKPEVEEDLGELLTAEQEAADTSRQSLRPPVVTIMGHVDHGKTKLLDTIRSANVVATEAGGITQHIGAYQVELQGKRITFLDTPGHEAFTAMRARGAQVTDIVMLVVAADDGVMPQTLGGVVACEGSQCAYRGCHQQDGQRGSQPRPRDDAAFRAGPCADPVGRRHRVYQGSARAGTGIQDLLETILLVAELGDLQSSPQRRATGTIVEAEMDSNRGPIATVLIQNGTLNLRDYVVAGATWGRVRAMQDDKGRKLRKAEPSTPAEILGLSGVPQAGDTLLVAPTKHSERDR